MRGQCLCALRRAKNSDEPLFCVDSTLLFPFIFHTLQCRHFYIISVLSFFFSGGFLFARYIHMCSQSRLFVSRSVFRGAFVCFYRRRRRCSSYLPSTTLPVCGIAIDGDIRSGWYRVGSWHATPIYRTYLSQYIFVFLFTYLYLSLYYTCTVFGMSTCVCSQREFFVNFVQWNFVWMYFVWWNLRVLHFPHFYLFAEVFFSSTADTKREKKTKIKNWATPRWLHKYIRAFTRNKRAKKQEIDV